MIEELSVIQNIWIYRQYFVQTDVKTEEYML